MRAQVSVFMVLAVIIVFLAAMVTLIQQEQVQSPTLITGINEHSQSLRNIIQSCLDESIQQNVLLFGLQGGYIVPRSSIESLDIDGFMVPYYIYEGTPVIPDADMLRDAQLSSSIESGVLDCVDDFQDFPFPVDYSSPEVKTQILPSKLTFDLTFPARVGVKDEIVVVPPRYTAIKDSRLGQTFAIAKKIASDPDSKRGFVDLLYLNDLTNLGYNVTVFPYDDDHFFYVLTDNQDRVYDLPFRFQFAVGVEHDA